MREREGEEREQGREGGSRVEREGLAEENERWERKEGGYRESTYAWTCLNVCH